VLLDSPFLAEYGLWELGTKGHASVLTKGETGECVGYGLTLATNCENPRGDCDGFPEELFGAAWRSEVTGQLERASGWPDGV
jgi:hypothetical protein